MIISLKRKLQLMAKACVLVGTVVLAMNERMPLVRQAQQLVQSSPNQELFERLAYLEEYLPLEHKNELCAAIGEHPALIELKYDRSLTLPVPCGSITSLAIDTFKDLIALGTQSGTIHVIQAPLEHHEYVMDENMMPAATVSTVHHALKLSQGPIRHLSFHRGGLYVADDFTLVLQELEEPFNCKSLYLAYPRCLKVSRAGNAVLSYNNERPDAIEMLRAPYGQESQRLAAQSQPIAHCAFDASEQGVLFSTVNKAVFYAAGQTVQKLRTDEQSEIIGLDLHPQEPFALIIHKKNMELYSLSGASAQFLFSYQLMHGLPSEITTAQFRPNGQLIQLGLNDGSIIVTRTFRDMPGRRWKIKTCTTSSPIRDHTISDDGQREAIVTDQHLCYFPYRLQSTIDQAPLISALTLLTKSADYGPASIAGHPYTQLVLIYLEQSAPTFTHSLKKMLGIDHIETVPF